MNEDKNKILRLILGIDTAEDRKSTLQLALMQARRLIGYAQGDEMCYHAFQLRKSNDVQDIDKLVESTFKANLDEEMDILTSLSLYLIVLDQLGHIFGSRSNKSNRVKVAIEKSNIDTGLIDSEMEEIADLRNSINHNFGLACYNPSKNVGVLKFMICFGDDGNQKPVIDSVEDWDGDWCDKSENTSVHVYPFSLINLIEKVLNSYIEQYNAGILRTPLCVEELKTRFTIK